MRIHSMIGAAALACATSACIQTPENGTSVRPGSVVHFEGYAPAEAGDLQLQAEVLTGYTPRPECGPQDPSRPRVTPQVCRNFPCTPVAPDCSGPGIPVYGWQTFATVHPSNDHANLFTDQNYELVSWSADVAVPSAAFRTLTGRNGSLFNGARVRAVMWDRSFYTVKPNAVQCWASNNGTLDQWISACTPGSDNQVLELRTAF